MGCCLLPRLCCRNWPQLYFTGSLAVVHLNFQSLLRETLTIRKGGEWAGRMGTLREEPCEQTNSGPWPQQGPVRVSDVSCLALRKEALST